MRSRLTGESPSKGRSVSHFSRFNSPPVSALWGASGPLKPANRFPLALSPVSRLTGACLRLCRRSYCSVTDCVRHCSVGHCPPRATQLDDCPTPPLNCVRHHSDSACPATQLDDCPIPPLNCVRHHSDSACPATQLDDCPTLPAP